MKHILKILPITFLFTITIIFLTCEDDDKNTNLTNDVISEIRSYTGKYISDVLPFLQSKNWKINYSLVTSMGNYELYSCFNSDTTKVYEIFVKDNFVFQTIYKRINRNDGEDLKSQFVTWEKRLQDYGLNDYFQAKIHTDTFAMTYSSRYIFINDLQSKLSNLNSTFEYIYNDNLYGFVEYSNLENNKFNCVSISFINSVMLSSTQTDKFIKHFIKERLSKLK